MEYSAVNVNSVLCIRLLSEGALWVLLHSVLHGLNYYIGHPFLVDSLEFQTIVTYKQTNHSVGSTNVMRSLIYRFLAGTFSMVASTSIIFFSSSKFQ